MYQVIAEHAKQVKNIWDNADCCPKSIKTIKNQFKEQVWEKYLFGKRDKCFSGENQTNKRTHKKKLYKSPAKLVEYQFHLLLIKELTQAKQPKYKSLEEAFIILC